MADLNLTTKMSGKMAGFHTLNTSPLDNKFCLAMSKIPDSICSKCYSQRAMKTYAPTARKPWKENGDILSKKKLRSVPVIEKEYFRFHAHGEILNETHYKNFITIAKHNPDTRFALWTKRKDIVAKLGKMGARNLTLIYSEPTINKIEDVPKNYDKIFTVFSKEFSEENDIKINCGSKNCMGCLICYEENEIKRVNEHLK